MKNSITHFYFFLKNIFGRLNETSKNLLTLHEIHLSDLKFSSKHTDLTDEELMQEIVASNNPDALGKLYSRYIPLVFGLCLKYLRNEAEAEDAVMQIYEEVSKKIANFEIINFKTWLYSVSKNHCLQLLRKAQPAFFQEINEQIVETDSFLHLINEEDNVENDKALQYCMTTLPEEQHSCIYRFFFEDCSYADIVEQTGFALNQVKSYIQNGKRNLKNCMIKALNL